MWPMENSRMSFLEFSTDNKRKVNLIGSDAMFGFSGWPFQAKCKSRHTSGQKHRRPNFHGLPYMPGPRSGQKIPLVNGQATFPERVMTKD